jgi:hypothetical protein
VVLALSARRISPDKPRECPITRPPATINTITLAELASLNVYFSIVLEPTWVSNHARVRST